MQIQNGGSHFSILEQHCRKYHVISMAKLGSKLLNEILFVNIFLNLGHSNFYSCIAGSLLEINVGGRNKNKNKSWPRDPFFLQSMLS
jgi:hypothetical protein